MKRTLFLICLLFSGAGLRFRASAQFVAANIYDANYSSLAPACTAAGSGTLVVTRRWDLLATATYTCNMAFTGGILQAAPGQTLTLAGNVACPAARQCFDTSLSGSVVFQKSQSVNVEWWGAPGNGSSDDCPGFIGALTSGAKLVYATGSTDYYAPCTLRPSSGQAIQFGPGTHQFDGFIIPDSATLKTAGNVLFLGQGSKLTELRQIGGANRDFIQSDSFYSLFDTGNQYGVNGLTIKGITIDGNSSNQTLTTVKISSVASTSPLAVTTGSGHGFTSGQVVCEKNIGGKPEADGCFVITVTGSTTYTLNNTASISTNTYTSGGVVTNNHENCIAVYGIRYRFDDLAVLNCAMNGILSGWNNEPADDYKSPLDGTIGMISNVSVQVNGFDGIRWHGPHDTYFSNIAGLVNGGWGMATDTIYNGATVLSAGSTNVNTIDFAGNTDGGIWNNGGMTGTGVTPSGTGTSTTWGMYIGPYGGGSIISAISLGGSLSLEINSVDNVIQGVCQNNATGTPCIKISGGYGNSLDVDGVIATGFLFAVYGESSLNRFRSHAVLSGGAQLFDPAHPPETQDIVDLSSYAGVNEFWQEHRQLNWNSTAVPNPGTVTTTSASATVTGSGTAFAANEAGGTLTVGTNSCVIASVTSSTSLTCTAAFGANNMVRAYTITALPLILTTNTAPIPNLTANWPLYSDGVQLINDHEVFGIITLNGASPSRGTATLNPAFTNSMSYLCVVSLISNGLVSYSPGWTNTSASLITLNGPSGATDTWSFRCAGH